MWAAVYSCLSGKNLFTPSQFLLFVMIPVIAYTFVIRLLGFIYGPLLGASSADRRLL
jgi:hypothetical protein